MYDMCRFIKETWTLGKMLFTSKPSDFEKLEMMPMKCYPFKGNKYLTWCGRCVYRENTSAAVITPVAENHENIHLDQAKYCGTWVKFYLRYLWSWMKISPFFQRVGYYTNKYETEAYAKEEDLDYRMTRAHNAVDKFDQENKREIWKQCHKSSYVYKGYIREKFK